LDTPSATAFRNTCMVIIRSQESNMSSTRRSSRGEDLLAAAGRGRAMWEWVALAGADGAWPTVMTSAPERSSDWLFLYCFPVI
jgi:hypothetical protein